MRLTAAALVALSQLAAAQAPIPIRPLTAPSATSDPLGSIEELREIAGGKVLVNDGNDRRLVLFDPDLRHSTALIDTAGTPTRYPRMGKVIRYTADSSLFYETDTRAFDLIDPQGKFIRVVALPRPQDFNMMTHSSPVIADGHGHLIYQGRRALSFPPACHLANDPPPVRPPATMAAAGDSVVIIRADFETRTVDSVGKVRPVVNGLDFPVTTTDANCGVTSARIRMNPSLPETDSWTVTSNGSVAIVRGHDYHIDFIDADGTRRSTAKLPYDWRRLTDDDKRAKIDSARHIADSLTAAGGYRLKACAGGRIINFDVEPPGTGGDVMIMGGPPPGRGLGGGGAVSATGAAGAAPPPPGRGPNDCQTLTVTAEFVPIDSMADYIAPIREESARADLDGNVWILPTTSSGARGGLLYDVVSAAGVLVERVQLPGGRDIAGFGHGGVVYLSHGDYKTGYVIEKVKVVR